MKHGFLKVAAITPQIKVADVEYNTSEVIRLAKEAADEGAKLLVFPELVITGYTCQDLFLQESLLDAALLGLSRIIKETKDTDALIFVGLPFENDGKLYNAAAVISRGALLAIIPKIYLPNYGEYYEARHFTRGNIRSVKINVLGFEVPFGSNVLFKECSGVLNLKIGVELCEDLWTLNPPSTAHVMNGANVIVNLSASNELVSKADYRKNLVAMTSARLVSAYIYASAGEGESTQDVVYGGSRLIAENGSVLGDSGIFNTGITYADIDINKLRHERRRMTTFEGGICDDRYAGAEVVSFKIKSEETRLIRNFNKMPFVPSDEAKRRERCEEILSIQALGLKKRLVHTGCKNAVVGLSGGLDSTLALLVMARAFDAADLDRAGIQCVTMPCFGTTDRTYENACLLAKSIGATLTEVDIKEAVRLHFRDIGQDESVHDVTYENGQARERTQILMDLANRLGGMVIGTGDMSELALGWATYNGDHMSMYGVNVGVPKTLVRHLVKYYADVCLLKGEKVLADVLLDILDTPVSPELLPPKEGEISQKTEDIVGPYELHDFFMYYMLRFGFAPAKIYRIARLAFEGEYDDDTILKWEKTFYRRFFSQHFKRSCLPDGPKVGTVAVSPRGDLRMPSDAMAKVWLAELEGLVIK